LALAYIYCIPITINCDQIKSIYISAYKHTDIHTHTFILESSLFSIVGVKSVDAGLTFCYRYHSSQNGDNGHTSQNMMTNKIDE
jgi:hypothetical protein